MTDSSTWSLCKGMLDGGQVIVRVNETFRGELPADYPFPGLDFNNPDMTDILDFIKKCFTLT